MKKATSAIMFPGMDEPIFEAVWSEEDLAVLGKAKEVLENPGFAAKATNLIGVPMEKALQALPDNWTEKIRAVTDKSLRAAMRAATKTFVDHSEEESKDLWHKAAVTVTGAAGGVFGLPALAIELPVSTTIMLRSISDIARSEGEDIYDPWVQLSCIEVFALGGRSKSDDAQDSAYFLTRAELSRAVSEAAKYIAEKGLTGEGGPAILRFVAAVTSRFGITVSEKAAAMAVPIVGGALGGLVNLLFIDHFQDMAHGHFTVRRLERKYGEDSVRIAYNEA